MVGKWAFRSEISGDHILFITRTYINLCPHALKPGRTARMIIMTVRQKNMRDFVFGYIPVSHILPYDIQCIISSAVNQNITAVMLKGIDISQLAIYTSGK